MYKILHVTELINFTKIIRTDIKPVSFSSTRAIVKVEEAGEPLDTTTLILLQE